MAIDDVGTGNASLACLPSLPVDCLKIDRSFVDVIARSPESDAVIRALVQLGKAFGVETLAEGVETADQLDHLDHGRAVSRWMSDQLWPATSVWARSPVGGR